MLKKSIYFLLSFLLIVLLALISVELLLQIIPVISRNIPLSKDKVYIYIIGESSSVGEPYSLAKPDFSYYKILEHIIGGKIDNKNIEFIKIAEGGSLVKIQYLDYFIYRYMHPFKRGLAFIYAGKNDWDNGKLIKPKKLNYDFKMLDLIRFCYRKTFKPDDESFLYKYEKLISGIKEFGDDILVSTIEGNYSGFMPLDNRRREYKEDFDKIDDEILINKNYEKAKEMLKQLEDKQDSDKSWVYYRYGKIAEFTGKIKEANDLFIKSRDFFSNLLPSKYQIDCIRMLAEKYNLPLVDIFDKVYNSGEIIGFNFYKDNQHLNIKLYITIAELFVKVLKEKFGDKVNIKRENITEEDIYKYFNFEKQDIYEVYRHSLDVLLVHSKENENVNRYIFGQADEYLRKITELNPYEGEQKQAIISFYSMMTEALKGNKEKMFEIYNKNKDIIEQNRHLYSTSCDLEEYNRWISYYLGIENFFNL